MIKKLRVYPTGGCKTCAEGVEYPDRNTVTFDQTLTTKPETGEPHASTSQMWKLILAYDGTDYRGWQVQPGQPTIQGELQAALGRVVGEAPLPQGSGRTDAGVHALAQVASFALRAPIPSDSLRRALNRTLPPAIRVLEAKIVGSDFHARHSTLAKTYEYRVYLERPPHSADRTIECPPFLARYVYAFPWPLDFPALQESGRQFVGTHDFLSFAATDPDEAARSGDAARFGEDASTPEYPAPRTSTEDKSTIRSGSIRTIFNSDWDQTATRDTTIFTYRVRGNGFLHHMVRNMVGTMLDVGRGYRRADEVPAIIAARSRAAAGPTAPPGGLFLHSVEYPPDE